MEADKPYITVIGKRQKIRKLYLLPNSVAHLKKYMEDFHSSLPNPNAYVFYSRNKGIFGKMTPESVNKQLKKYAAVAHEICPEIPLSLHAHQLRHSKASHWLEDGMNIVQISFLLGHANPHTTMAYLDITTEQVSKASATLEDENQRGIPKNGKPNQTV